HALQQSKIARYTGNVRLWQGSNVIESQVAEFASDHKQMTAWSDGGKRVATVYTEVDASGHPAPVNVTSDRLVYSDEARHAHLTGNVLLKRNDETVRADQADLDLVKRTGGANRLEKLIADGHVVVQQPTRKATGKHLVYQSAESKYVLTGSA